MNALFPVISAYLIGSIPTGFIVGKLWAGKDIRRLGSGNPGTANALRVFGPIPGLLVFLLDAGKGWAALFIASCLGANGEGLWWAALAVVFGHIYPVFMGFCGGKGLATGLAVVAALFPLAIPVFAVLWIPAFLMTRNVPAASTIGMAGVLATTAVYAHIPGVLGSGVIIWRHWPETFEFIKTIAGRTRS